MDTLIIVVFIIAVAISIYALSVLAYAHSPRYIVRERLHAYASDIECSRR
jgi:hypothetical protein